MSSLGRKLSRLGTAGPGARPPEEPPAVASPSEAPPAEDDGWDAFRAALRSKATREARRPAPSPMEAMELPGERLSTEHGPLHRIATQRPLHAEHGGVPHRALLEIDPAALARFALDPALASIDPSKLVFLDTETTGLAGGAGTVPFLVGIARLRDGELQMEQWLLRRFGEEGPILRRLAEVLEDASGLVTYNGKSFDWPLLRTRYVLHRMPQPPLRFHLDLVHGARRVLGERLPSVRLADVERELLGLVREGDVEGWAIPEIFLEFQRTGAHPDMPRVIRHHALDLLAMPAIVAKLAGFFGGTERPSEALDRLACAKVAARAGHDDASRRLLASMLEDEVGEVASRGALLAARQARRAGDLPAERAGLERAVAEARDDDARAFALLALAKHLEHRAKDLAAALAQARLANAILGDDAVQHRIERLERRLARAAARE